MVIGYAMGLVLFFVDFLKDNRIANRVGVSILGIVWLLETFFMGIRIVSDHVWPFFSSGQATIFYAWLLITVSVLVSYFSRIDYFTFFINLLGFLFVAFDTFVHNTKMETVPRQGDLLLLHIGIAFLSYIAFAVSSIFSVLYLLEDFALRRKRFASGPFRRLPPLEGLEVFAFRSVIVGLPLLLIAVVLGSVWYMVLTGRLLIWDAKPIASLLLLLLYSVYVYLRVSGRVSDRKAAWLNLLCFFGVIVNFLVIGSYMSGFHRW